MSELAVAPAGPGVVAPAGNGRQPLDAVARLARLAMTPCGPDEVLRELCRVAASVMTVDGIGVMQVLADEGAGRTRYVDAQSEVRAVERMQDSLQRGPCREAVDTGQVVVIEDIHAVADRYGRVSTGMVEAGMRAVIVVPLLARGRAWGTLDLYRRRPGTWADDDVDVARLLADIAVSYLVMASDRDEARAARQAVEHRSLHDDLTGLPNRLLLFDRIEHELASADRHGTVVGIAFVDLDRFKRVNDTLGHAAGDEVLAEVARRLAAAVRGQDTPARLAGDEFVVVLADLPPDAHARTEVVTQITDRLRRVLAEPIPAGGGPVLVTASVGVVVAAPGPAVTAEGLVHEADVAMYVAKAQRDAVVVHDRRGARPGP